MNILIPSVFLLLFGLFNLFGVNQSLFYRQLPFIVISLIFYFIVKTIGRNFFKTNYGFFFWVFILILIITFIIGIEVKGSRRWLDFYFFRFQPSEIFKVFFILFMSNFLTRKKIMENKFSFFLKGFVLFIVPAFIVFKQPDLGNAAVFVFIYFMMIIFSDFSKLYLVYLSLISAAVLPLGFLILKNYQRDRLLSFFNPHLDTQGISYNMIQSIITIGSGQFFGRGLGLGTQSRLFFLPENTTDFAFATLVEQFGFFGGFLVIVFYGVLIFLIIKRAFYFFYNNNLENKSDYLYCIGILAYIVFQVFVNIGMNMGLLPVAGVALPFISYGGSSVLALLIGFALLP